MLSIAYISGPEQKQTKPNVDDVTIRIQRRYRKDFQKGLKEHAELIKEVQKRIPGWMPKFEI